MLLNISLNFTKSIFSEASLLLNYSTAFSRLNKILNRSQIRATVELLNVSYDASEVEFGFGIDTQV